MKRVLVRDENGRPRYVDRLTRNEWVWLGFLAVAFVLGSLGIWLAPVDISEKLMDQAAAVLFLGIFVGVGVVLNT